MIVNAHDAGGDNLGHSFWQELIGVPFRQSYVDAGGVRTRFLETGKRGSQALIFLHGFMSHADVFIRNLRTHGEYLNTFAIDLIGMGYSDRPDYNYHAPVIAKQVRDFMDAMGIESAHIAGTSFGSRIAARFAADYPERIDKLTMIAPVRLDFDPDHGAYLIHKHMIANDQGTWTGAKALLQTIFDPNKLIPDLVASRRMIYGQTGIRTTDQHLAVYHEPETAQESLVSEQDYQSIIAPTLLIKAGDEAGPGSSTTDTLAFLIPDARVREIHGCMHAPYFERPGEFNDIHLEFLLEPD